VAGDRAVVLERARPRYFEAHLGRAGGFVELRRLHVQLGNHDVVLRAFAARDGDFDRVADLRLQGRVGLALLVEERHLAVLDAGAERDALQCRRLRRGLLLRRGRGLRDREGRGQRRRHQECESCGSGEERSG
jgi:hypothetical protein